MDDLTVSIDISSASISLKSMKDRHNGKESVFLTPLSAKLDRRKLPRLQKSQLTVGGARSAYEHELIHGLSKNGKDWLCITRRVHEDIFQ